jgi:hypothetical protein
MLSWSGHEQDCEIDLAALGRGEAATSVALNAELHAFATAASGVDGAALHAARAELITAADGLGLDGTAVMVDAAAVVANFEMMTRLADGTGARFPEEVANDRHELSVAMGVDTVASRR